MPSVIHGIGLPGTPSRPVHVPRGPTLRIKAAGQNEPVDTSYARVAWRLVESIHAVTYFAPECREANRAVGLRGFWMGYFGSRGAPLGPVPPGVVEALFFNFHPGMVRRAIPDAWHFADPSAITEARAAAAATALRRLIPEIGDAAAAANPLLDQVIEAADGAGRPLFAANRDLPRVADPAAALWQAATTLREHRGDGHVAVLAAEGLTGCEAHVLTAAVSGTPVEVLRDNRGWSAEEWEQSARRLAEADLVDPDGHATDPGRALRERIEQRTDELAVRPYEVLADPDRLVELLDPLARAVSESGMIPYPNPIGLPRP